MASSIRPIRSSLQEYGRGIVGGLIFAFAPLYTMELWWQGFLTTPPVLLFATLGTIPMLVAYAHYAGLHEERSLLYNVAEALESLAIGVLIAFVVLTLVGQLPWDLSLLEFVSRLALEGLVSAIGVAVGSAQLGAKPQDDQESSMEDESKPSGFLHGIAYSSLGAILIMAGFTPTQEVVTIGMEADPVNVLIVVVLSFGLALGILSYFDMRGADEAGGTYAGGALGDAFVTYGIALVLSASLLWTVGRFDQVGLAGCVFMTVYLAWPATIGSAAGRLLL